MTNVSADSSVNVIFGAWGFILSCQAELLLFCAAIAAYLLLFANTAPRSVRTKKKIVEQAPGSTDGGTDLRKRNNTQRGFHTTSDDRVGSDLLDDAVENLQVASNGKATLRRELEAVLKKYNKGSNINSINRVIESFCKRLSAHSVENFIEVLPSMGLNPDQKTFELLLNAYSCGNQYSEMSRVVAEMKRQSIPLTIRATICVIQAAAKTNNFEDAIAYFRTLTNQWKSSSATTTPSMAPRHVISLIIELACKTNNLERCLSELGDVPITEEAVHTLLVEAARKKDANITDQVERLAREKGISLGDSAQSLLIKGMTSDTRRMDKVFNDIVERGEHVGPQVAIALLGFCSTVKDTELAGRLYMYMKPKQMQVLAAFVQFFYDSEQFDKACDIYEHDMQGTSSTDAGALQQSLFLDARVERALIDAALRCGRAQLVKELLHSTPLDVAKHVSMIRSCTAARNVQGAKDAFEMLRQSGAELNSVVYNAVLDVCVECFDIGEAEAWMEKMKSAKMCDVVTYNTVIKAHLRLENFGKARKLVDEMKSMGLEPNRVTFNELVNGIITKGSESERARKWDLIREMKDMGVPPNQVTCAILLKSLNSRSSQKDITETMELINTMQEPMDEILVSSVVEACVRIGQPQLIASKLKQINTGSLIVSGSHTFGSLIKAYGYARDMEGAWRCWREMRSRRIKPTCITLGCMVEAVVSNGDTDGAYALVQEVKADEQLQGMLNSVIYCSVLKGFAREKKFDRLWQVYQEMVDDKIDVSVVTYNTLVDACVRSDRRDRVPAIFEDMKAHGVKPNIVTYSGVIKGHCLAGDVQKGFEVMDEMKRTTGFKPDEIMYNSLLDGCANNHLTEAGLRVIQLMQTEGVPPSNYTLSLIVKLLSRARKLDRAFELVDQLCQKYNLQPNVHVRTNLIQACISNRQLNRGMSTLEEMIKAGVRPEARTYSILVRACLQQLRWSQASQLVRGGLGLPGAPAYLQKAACSDFDPALVNETLHALACSGRAEEFAVPLISDVKQFLPRLRIDNGVHAKVMTSGLSEAGAQSLRAQRNCGGNGGHLGKSSKGEDKGRRNRE